MNENYYIGIDVGKFKHCAAIISNYGEVKVNSFFFSNDQSGFKKLYDSIKPYVKVKHLIGMEDTGHYADNLRIFLLDKELSVAMINPISTDAFRKALMKTTKTDKQDALFIAQVIQSPSLYRTVKKSDFDYHEMRELTRYHHKMKETCQRHKARLQKCIDIVFPEFNSLFSNSYGSAYMRLLSEFQSADTIANTDIRKIRNVLKPKGRGRTVSFTAEQLKELAKSSVGQPSPTLEMEIKHLVELIQMIDNDIQEADKKIEEFSKNLNSPILYIPGISHFAGISIISELSDIKRFSSSNKVIRFAGVNPIVYQSGQYNASMTKISKKGSKYLRKTLYQIIVPVIDNNPVFKEYYNKKINEGKTPRCAQGHCVRKLLRVIYHLLTTEQEYNPALLR